MERVVITPNRAEQVYHSIRDSICDGRLAPGTHLVQESLAARLGVSRQPVQQAMLLLKNDGLVLERGSRGLYVAPVDASATIDRYQIRVGFDQLAARLCATRAGQDPAFAAELLHKGGRIIDAGLAAVRRENHREAVGHDVGFHCFLYEQSGNALLAATAEPLWHYLRRVMITVLRFAERGPLVWTEHRDILDTLARGDVEDGVHLVTEHIAGAEKAILRPIDDALPIKTA